MKAVINEKETPVKPEYPKLMVNKHGIESAIGLVLALSETSALHLVGNFQFEYAEGFGNLHRDFTPFTGSITLSND